MRAFLILPMFLFCCCETSTVITKECPEHNVCDVLDKVVDMEARLKATEQQVASILQTGKEVLKPTAVPQHTTLQKRFDALQASYKNRTEDRDQLQTRYNSIAEERDQLRTSFDELQRTCNIVTQERDNLKRRMCESDGFRREGNHCYYVSTDKRTWDEARQFCRNRQADLMVVNSPEKQAIVERINQYVWLGLNDREIEGYFKWVDGTPLTYPTYWAPGEPDKRLGDGDCVVFLPHTSRGWHDASCVNPKCLYICERLD